jgi:hypothetical protein
MPSQSIMMDSHSSSTRAYAKKLRCVASFDSPDRPKRNVQKMITPLCGGEGIHPPAPNPLHMEGTGADRCYLLHHPKGATSNLAAFRSCGAYAAWHCLRTYCPVGGRQARLGPCFQHTYLFWNPFHWFSFGWFWLPHHWLVCIPGPCCGSSHFGSSSGSSA